MKKYKLAGTVMGESCRPSGLLQTTEMFMFQHELLIVQQSAGLHFALFHDSKSE